MASRSRSNVYSVNKDPITGMDLPPDLRNVPRKDWQKIIDAYNKKQIEKQANLPTAVLSSPNAKVRAGVDYKAPPRPERKSPEEVAKSMGARKAKEAGMAFDVATIPFLGLKSAGRGLYEGGKQIYKHGDNMKTLIAKLLSKFKGKADDVIPKGGATSRAGAGATQTFKQGDKVNGVSITKEQAKNLNKSMKDLGKGGTQALDRGKKVAETQKNIDKIKHGDPKKMWAEGVERGKDAPAAAKLSLNEALGPKGSLALAKKAPKAALELMKKAMGPIVTVPAALAGAGYGAKKLFEGDETELEKLQRMTEESKKKKDEAAKLKEAQRDAAREIIGDDFGKALGSVSSVGKMLAGITREKTKKPEEKPAHYSSGLMGPPKSIMGFGEAPYEEMGPPKAAMGFGAKKDKDKGKSKDKEVVTKKTKSPLDYLRSEKEMDERIGEVWDSPVRKRERANRQDRLRANLREMLGEQSIDPATGKPTRTGGLVRDRQEQYSFTPSGKAQTRLTEAPVKEGVPSIPSGTTPIVKTKPSLFESTSPDTKLAYGAHGDPDSTAPYQVALVGQALPDRQPWLQDSPPSALEGQDLTKGITLEEQIPSKVTALKGAGPKTFEAKVNEVPTGTGGKIPANIPPPALEGQDLTKGITLEKQIPSKATALKGAGQPPTDDELNQKLAAMKGGGTIPHTDWGKGSLSWVQEGSEKTPNIPVDKVGDVVPANVTADSYGWAAMDNQLPEGSSKTPAHTMSKSEYPFDASGKYDEQAAGVAAGKIKPPPVSKLVADLKKKKKK